MVRTLAEFIRHDLLQPQLDGQRVLARCKAGAVGDSEDVGVDSDGRHAEGLVHHHIGGLAADTGQGFQRVPVGGNLAAMPLDQQL